MRRVLVVEDSGFFSTVLKNNLGMLNYVVDTASSISEAWEKLQEKDYDLITLDVYLPDGDGYEFCKKIKNDPRYYKIQIAIITSETGDEAKKKAYEVGAIAFFTKADTQKKLAEFITNLDRLVKTIDYSGNNVLLIEDSKTQNLYIKGLLEYAGITVYSYYSLEEAKEVINISMPKIDLVILDYYVDDGTSKEFIKFFKSIKLYEHTPVMIITIANEPFVKYDLFLLGASDFLTKPFDVGEFYLRVRSHLRIKYLIDMLDTKNKMLSILATTDDLTKSYNRRFFWEVAKKEETRANRYKSNYSIIMLDIDNFKNINDTYGHNVGDFVLKKLADAIKLNIRNSDTLARFGGEEFVILLPETDKEKAFLVAEKIRNKVENMEFDEINEKVTVSFGVASRDEANDLDEVIKIADERLYKAKETGKNKVVIE
ncbi:diguanylate cyclase [Deferribacter autotrophicus]|uniref:diguanylate cyclase n=1 Tax=Deferribacter autotrophicus TaxID=500465 RepID=A0A5A8F8C2_9BACT|nr:diguanylate cyclase [Deferribacter autotrophicus]KAA0259558.1 diguanylate cyclase [Deferribacter autotrophicus]